LSETHIGIDFDNTLACFDEVFVRIAHDYKVLPFGWDGGKPALRNFLRSKKGGEETWQLLQGQVYGRLMHQAQLKPGAGWFLLRCKARGLRVSVVSHKTQFSPKDPQKIRLRDVALEWMTRNGFFDPSRFGISQDAVYFEGTRQEKVRRIVSLGCTHFIDDLAEVFDEKDFPPKVQKILFSVESFENDTLKEASACSSWTSIGNAILGQETKQDLISIAKTVLPDAQISACYRIKCGGNSAVYQIHIRDGESLALKRYPVVPGDKRDRLYSEVAACRFLRENGIDQVPFVVRTDKANQLAAFEWIHGDLLDMPNYSHLTHLIEFVRKLDSLREVEAANQLLPASEACFSGKDVCHQIQLRRGRLGQLKIECDRLFSFLSQEFDPVFVRAADWAQHHWPHRQRFDEDLPTIYRTLSPSDLGFHNALWERRGVLRIIDLEYFGWDDPVKLASDFCWHPGMALDQKMRNQWIAKLTDIYARDKSFLIRLRAAHPLYGLRWAMIVLNSFAASQVTTPATVEGRRGQLRKSMDLCRRVALWMQDENSSF